MNVVKEILFASSILATSSSVYAENVEVQNELQKNKKWVLEILYSSSHPVVWNKPTLSSSEKNKEYFKEYVLPKIKVPITENMSWWVFKSHTGWSVVGIKYQLNTSPLQREHISVWVGKDNKAEIVYSLKF